MLGFLKRLFGGKRGGGECDHGPQTTPEEEFAIAERVMAAGELRHAAIHLGNALSDDPLRPEWLALLDRLITIAPDPLALAPLEDNNYVGTVALHAYVLNHLGRLDDALNAALQAAVAKPTVPYLEWPIRWLEDPANANRTTGAAFLHLMKASFETPGLLRDPANRPLTESLPRLAAAVRRTQTPEPEFYVAAARVLRMSGHPDAALETARAAFDAAPGFATAVSVAATLRDAGDVDGALAMYEKASGFDPADVSALLDRGDLNWEHGRRDEAVRCYEAAVEKEPDHPWATPSLYALRYEMTGDEDWRVKLASYANAHPGNDRARSLASQCVFPYFGSYLPDPGDAVVNTGKQLIESSDVNLADIKDDGLKMTVSGLESPSAVRSLERELRRRGFPGSLNLTVTGIAKPDPRQPRGRVEHTLWRYEGTTASPALPEPPADVAGAVAALARTPYSLDAWWREAQNVGPRLGADAIPALLAVMVHPPADPPENLPWWTWTYRVQVAAALIVAGTDAQTPWPDSARRAALLSLVRGPMDWSVEAGIIALAVVAREDPRIAEEAKALLFEAVKTAPRGGYVNYLDTALCALAQLPNLSERERADVDKQFKRLQKE